MQTIVKQEYFKMSKKKMCISHGNDFAVVWSRKSRYDGGRLQHKQNIVRMNVIPGQDEHELL